jgi:hypothetical protein
MFFFLIGRKVNVKHMTKEEMVNVGHVDFKSSVFEIRSANNIMNALKTITEHVLPLCEHISVRKHEPKK